MTMVDRRGCHEIKEKKESEYVTVDVEVRICELQKRETRSLFLYELEIPMMQE